MQADNEFRLPEFDSVQRREEWWNSRPSDAVEVDPKLLETVSTSIRLPALTIEGYKSLANKLGFRSGQTLMRAVRNNFLVGWQEASILKATTDVHPIGVRLRKASPNNG